jgi:peroxiredoxin Q/BCP
MLQIGDKAPHFKSKDQEGNEVKLSDYSGRKLILYFYPEDDTPTCTEEACNLRDNYALLKKNGFAILGVSPQDVSSHEKFSKKFDLPFPLLADPSLRITKAYGCWALKKLWGHEYMGVLRYTFVIDEKGRVERIFRKVFSKRHTQQILDSYSE